MREFSFSDPMNKKSKVKIYDAIPCVIYKVIDFIIGVYILQ